MMFILRVVLYPFAVLYDIITRIRNHMYDTGMKPSTQFDLPVICVGNLAMGGTGKTPMVEYLIRLLPGRIAVVSRGYRRKTKGVRVAGDDDNAATIGDEPYQVHRKFPNVTVAVGEDRAYTIPYVLDHVPDTSIVILDDAFQHRRIRPSFSILLTEFVRPFYRDFVLPSGRLRESRRGAARADVVVVTKCPPNLSARQEEKARKAIRRYTDRPVFFASIRYGLPIPFGGNTVDLQEKIVLVTGIANPEPALAYLSQGFHVVHHVNNSDHYRYTMADLESLREHAQDDISIITTEKDMVKLDALALSAPFRLPLFYLPIEMVFLKDGSEFDDIVRSAVRVNDSGSDVL
ncbi:MAG TPA: tetraacyldisaccharide 4'-kinase [Cyclobacteriaceae bacterium]|nr:tetraacyldisaccharide 4'-kinase [Cyclobacteriaceae bacterium]